MPDAFKAFFASWFADPVNDGPPCPGFSKRSFYDGYRVRIQDGWRLNFKQKKLSWDSAELLKEKSFGNSSPRRRNHGKYDQMHCFPSPLIQHEVLGEESTSVTDPHFLESDRITDWPSLRRSATAEEAQDFIILWYRRNGESQAEAVRKAERVEGDGKVLYQMKKIDWQEALGDHHAELIWKHLQNIGEVSRSDLP